MSKATGKTARKHSIAVVDDAPVLRRILIALLEKDYSLTEFASGEEFLAAASSFDLVLLDIDMAQLDGYEVCRRLRARESGGDVPVVFVSGHDAPEERIAAYQAGGTDFIIKPVAADEVRHKVATILSRQSELESLASASLSANSAALSAKNAVSELSVIIECLHQIVACEDGESVAQSLLDALETLGIVGAVQIRMPQGVINRSSKQNNNPLQDSIMDSLRNMGHVFVFGSRGVVNTERVSALAVNLPRNDEPMVNRLREHLIRLVDATELRVGRIVNGMAKQLLLHETARMLDKLRVAVADAGGRTQAARSQSYRQTSETLESLGRMVQGFSITDIQRETIAHMIRDALEDLSQLNDDSISAEAEIKRAAGVLDTLCATAARLS